MNLFPRTLIRSEPRASSCRAPHPWRRRAQADAAPWRPPGHSETSRAAAAQWRPLAAPRLLPIGLGLRAFQTWRSGSGGRGRLALGAPRGRPARGWMSALTASTRCWPCMRPACLPFPTPTRPASTTWPSMRASSGPGYGAAGADGRGARPLAHTLILPWGKCSLPLLCSHIFLYLSYNIICGIMPSLLDLSLLGTFHLSFFFFNFMLGFRFFFFLIYFIF